LQTKTYNLSELRSISHITRQEADDWTRRGIISAEQRPGSGRHRAYSFNNLVEAVLAKSLSQRVRASSIEKIIVTVRQFFEMGSQILDPANDYSPLIFDIRHTGEIGFRGRELAAAKSDYASNRTEKLSSGRSKRKQGVLEKSLTIEVPGEQTIGPTALLQVNLSAAIEVVLLRVGVVERL
jgi:DNA-binding transcriptional MerR regulator